MKRKALALGLASTALASMVAVPVFAQGFGWGNGGTPPRGEPGPRPEPTEEMVAYREAVDAAIEAGDYGAWVEAVGDRPMVDDITAENFPRFVEMHKLMAQAHELMQQASQIGDELGLHPNRGMGRGMGVGPGPGRGMGCDLHAAGQTGDD